MIYRVYSNLISGTRISSCDYHMAATGNSQYPADRSPDAPDDDKQGSGLVTMSILLCMYAPIVWAAVGSSSDSTVTDGTSNAAEVLLYNLTSSQICEANNVSGLLEFTDNTGNPNDPICMFSTYGRPNSTVPEDRNRCLSNLTLSDGSAASRCYRTMRDHNVVVTTIRLDNTCMLNGPIWLSCIAANPTQRDPEPEVFPEPEPDVSE